MTFCYQFYTSSKYWIFTLSLGGEAILDCCFGLFHNLNAFAISPADKRIHGILILIIYFDFNVWLPGKCLPFSFLENNCNYTFRKYRVTSQWKLKIPYTKLSGSASKKDPQILKSRGLLLISVIMLVWWHYISEYLFDVHIHYVSSWTCVLDHDIQT